MPSYCALGFNIWIWGTHKHIETTAPCCWVCWQMIAPNWVPLRTSSPEIDLCWGESPLAWDHTPLLCAACIKHSVWGCEGLAPSLSAKTYHGVIWALVVITSQPHFSFCPILLSLFPLKSQEHSLINFLRGNLVSESSFWETWPLTQHVC